MDQVWKVEETQALIRNVHGGHVYAISLNGDPGLTLSDLKHYARVDFKGRFLAVAARGVALEVFQNLGFQVSEDADYATVMFLSTNDSPQLFERQVTLFSRSITPRINMKPTMQIPDGRGGTLLGPGVAIQHSALQVLLDRGVEFVVTAQLIAVLP